MEARIVEKKEHVLRIVPRDSMGRTKEQARDMEKNENHLRRGPKLSEADSNVHTIAAENLSEFPKTLYETAVTKDGVPCGDELLPGCPLAFDLAASDGLDDVGFKIVGKKRDDGGHVVVRYPWKTHKCGVMLDEITCDVEASRSEEKRLRARGCVEHPSKLKLPDTPVIRWFFSKSEPTVELWSESQDAKPNGKAQIGKTA